MTNRHLIVELLQQPSTCPEPMFLTRHVRTVQGLDFKHDLSTDIKRTRIYNEYLIFGRPFLTRTKFTLQHIYATKQIEPKRSKCSHDWMAPEIRATSQNFNPSLYFYKLMIGTLWLYYSRDEYKLYLSLSKWLYNLNRKPCSRTNLE